MKHSTLLTKFKTNYKTILILVVTLFSVSKILAQIVTTDKDRLKSVYDPTCGSGSLLLRVAKEVKTVGSFFGQESNPTTYNLCRMNMIMHNVHYKKFDIYNEDTLVNPSPKHIEKRFEAIVANPPFFNSECSVDIMSFGFTLGNPSKVSKPITFRFIPKGSNPAHNLAQAIIPPP